MLKTFVGNQNKFVFLLVGFLIILGMQVVSYADITPVSARTSQVRDAIVAAVPGIDAAADVTETHLTAITSLNLRNVGISELNTGDFSGMTGLTSLNLYGNELSSLPNGIFEGLTALTTLRLGGNTVDPLPISVSLEKTDDGQLKAVAPTGAPFDIVLPISATNGSIADNTTSLAISKGSTESNAVTVSRTADTTDAVTANIGTLPSLPQNHYGYTLSKSSALPVEIISEVITTTPIVPKPVEPEPPTNIAPVFTDGVNTIRTIAENTAAATNIGTAVGATDADDDTLIYTLSGTDAAAFDIDSSSGQLKNKTTLDYEIKKIYTITITVSDGSLTDTITVVISVIDVAETTLVLSSLPVSERTPAVRDAIVTAVPNITAAEDVTVTHLSAITTLNLRGAGITALQSGDFAGLTGLTSLNLYGNMLTSLPSGIFDGLSSLTALRLGGNLVDPLPMSITLQQVADGQFKAVIPTGAPFDVVVPVAAMMITIPQGSMESEAFTADASVTLGALPTLPANHFGYILAKSDVCNRTLQVSEAITAAVPGITDCRNITEVHLATITSLNLSSKSITSLASDDFAGLLSLVTLDLSNNQLSSLPAGIFNGLTTLTTVNLSGNTVSPMQISVALEKVGTNQVKAIVPLGAPFSITLPISVANGSLSSGTNLTIPTGSVESSTQTITRTSGTTAAVTVDIGTIPNLPSLHSGYGLVKTNQQPLEIFKRINVAPVFTEGTTATRTIAENTAADTNIGTAIVATDANNDTLTYSLSGTDVVSFDIGNTTGQLKTKAALDYETKTSYSVTITVSDGSLTDTINVTINVTDVDENRAPVFTEGNSTSRAIAENTGSGVDIGTAVSATDADDDTLTYALSGTDAASFSINSTSGQLRTKSVLDYETKDSYSVTITVSDGDLTDTIDVTINVTDVDETPAVTTKDNEKPNNAPVFTEGNSTSRTITENTASGVDIGDAVSATDEDKDDTLTYSLGGTDSSSFGIDSSSGQLRTSATLDYEAKDSYSVTITVSDGKGGSDSISVTINITNVDESAPNNTPTFTDGDSTTRTVAENTATDTNIGIAITATDADDDSLTYSISGTDSTSFSFVNTSGQLKTKDALNHETKSSYAVIISVSDGKGGSDSISVTINVTNVNEAPIFADDTTTRAIAENVGANINIGTAVKATDPDTDDSLTYTLGGTNAASFAIDDKTGQLKTKAALDFETKSSYSVTVTAKDAGNLTDSISVTINVTNLDETPSNIAPIFDDGDSTTRSIAENTAADVSIGTPITATDTDSNTLAYVLGGDGASSFSIDLNTGQLKTSGALNYETKDSYTVTVTVSDGSQNDTTTVTINVTDVNEAPVFADDSTALSVVENTVANTNIGSAITATDPDEDTLEYTLGGTDAVSFGINSETGQLKTEATLDYETETSYSVTITASDGSLEDTITVTITVMDVDENRAPTFLLIDFSYSITDIANASVGDSIGLPVTATDADNDTLSYSVGGDDASYFSIVSSSGQLQVTQALIDDLSSSYSIKVIAADPDNATAAISGTINVTRVLRQVLNSAPEFDEGSTATRSVDKGTYPSQDLGDPVSATDADDDTLEYSLGGTDAALFEIDSTNGQLSNKNFLHYDDKTSYSVTITASDSNGGTDTITVTITDDKPPVMEILTFIRQNEPNWVLELDSGTGVVSAVIPTDDRPQSRNSDVASFTRPPGVQFDNSFIVSISFDEEVSGLDQTELTLTENTAGANVTSWEALMGWTGNNTVTQYRAKVEVTQSGSVTFSVATGAATDGSGNSNADAVSKSVTVTITLTEYPPWDVNEDGSVDATDSALVTAALGQTGEAIVNSRTDVNWDDTVDADDVTLVTYHIETDVDENRAPTFSGSSISFSITDIANASVGDSIGFPITATDADTDTLSYSVGGDDASYFSIDSSSGQLKVTQALIDDSSTSYSIKVIATDPNNATAEISVTITVTRLSTQQQQSNSAPTFDDGATTTRPIAENTDAGENIGDPVAATDADTSDTLTYSLEGTDAASFSIVSTSGQLQTSAALDFETKDSYEVTVKVTDGSGASNNSATITVTISISDVNDAPVFQYGSSVTLSVNKRERLGTSIRATDDDEDDLTYTLGGTDAAFFSLNENYEYYLQSNAALDYDGKTSYSVTMTVDDDNGGSDTIAITITDPVPEVEIWTLIGYEEPDWVLKLDTETGIVKASLCDDEICLFATSLLEHNSTSFTRPPGVQFDNNFSVTVVFSEEVSGFEQSELTLTDNTAGATISSWQSQRTHFGYVFDATINVTTSGSVTFNVAAGVATDSGDQLNTAAESATFTVTITLTDYPPWDVNEDGSVDPTDTALVTAALGQTGADIVNERTDVNWDDTVDADDVTLVTYHIADDGGAPSLIGAFSLLDKKTLEKLDPVTLQGYLDILRAKSDGSPRYLRAIALVESVLSAIRPNKTQLLANFPNPFNPETWIPYHLADPNNVRISIYNMQGVVVRRLEIGHQPAGYYTSRSRAAYWDGTNDVGERVSNGIYYYQLKADSVSFLRKMVILK